VVVYRSGRAGPPGDIRPEGWYNRTEGLIGSADLDEFYVHDLDVIVQLHVLHNLSDDYLCSPYHHLPATDYNAAACSTVLVPTGGPSAYGGAAASRREG